MNDWDPSVIPPQVRVPVTAVPRVLLRGLALLVVILAGLAAHGLLRLVERPLHGQERPWTPAIVQWVCRSALWILGLTLRLHGDVMQHPGAVVANHGSWLDIFVLNARKRIYFVAKAEVRGWPLIGWLARATGTVFIKRDRREAKAQTELFKTRLGYGHRLLFFPEGTSTDGRRVLPFKPTLFAAFLAEGLAEIAYIQPVSVAYHAPEGAEDKFYGWWGDMDFGPHLLSTLAAARQGSVTIQYHAPVRVAEIEDRKALARLLENKVRAGLIAAGVNDD